MQGVSDRTTITRCGTRRLLAAAGVLAMLAGGFVLLVGPWPQIDTPFEDSDYARRTIARIETIPRGAPTGPLLAGAAKVDITPRTGEPLAGFGHRDPKASEGTPETMYARAITLTNGRSTVTIVGGDLLLVMRELRDAILQRLPLPRREIYFTATHTHSGPGAYSTRWVDQFVLGGYDADVAERLADAFAEAIRRSRASLAPATLHTQIVRPPDERAKKYGRNRVDDTADAHGTLAAMVVRDAAGGQALATMVVASGHPTCFGRRNRTARGDYPSRVVAEIEQRLGGVGLFAIGAPGSMAVADNGSRGEQRATRVAESIVRELQQAGAIEEGVEGSRRVAIAAAVLEVDLPPHQYPLGESLRLSPVITRLLHDRSTSIHAIRVGDVVLLGMPADYSGELAMALEASIGSKPQPLVTSFNGDYIGYLLPTERYARSDYETRDMNVFGRWCGAYFNDLARRLVVRLSDMQRSQRPITFRGAGDSPADLENPAGRAKQNSP